MSKRTRWIGLCCIVCLISFITVRYYLTEKQPTTENRTVALNMATNGKFSAGYVQVRNVEGDIKPGFYDVTSTKPMNVAGYDVDKDNPLVSQIFYNNNSLEIEGEGEAVFTPAKFKKLDFSSWQTVTIKNTASYRSPEDIEAGTYRIWSNKKQQLLQISENIDDVISTEKILSGKKNAKIITLKKNETISFINNYGRKSDMFIEKVQ